MINQNQNINQNININQNQNQNQNLNQNQNQNQNINQIENENQILLQFCSIFCKEKFQNLYKPQYPSIQNQEIDIFSSDQSYINIDENNSQEKEFMENKKKQAIMLLNKHLKQTMKEENKKSNEEINKLNEEQKRLQIEKQECQEQIQKLKELNNVEEQKIYIQKEIKQKKRLIHRENLNINSIKHNISKLSKTMNILGQSNKLKLIDIQKSQIEKKQAESSLFLFNSQLSNLKLHLNQKENLLSLFSSHFKQENQLQKNLHLKIQQRNSIVDNIIKKMKKTKKETKYLQKFFDFLSKKQLDYDLPSVIEYLELKTNQTKLKRKLDYWNKKLFVFEQLSSKSKK